ncbi:MAG TPA: signal peptide peptidase SppA [Epsilonproteobacteria bacterium]|nr:signal peptide peptidase SppA [Campylobacterota bacterium]
MEDIKDYEIKDLKRKIFITNLKAWMIGILLVAEVIIIGAFFMKSGLLGEPESGENRVAVINFNEMITEEYTTKVMEKMDKVLKKDEYKEVLFVMSSPGGSPTASEELSEYLKAYDTQKNITMYVSSMAASGGYYIASAVKPLIANKNAVVGSIGVIMPHFNLGPLAEKVGIEEDNVATGEFKQPISMFKKVDEKNREYLDSHLLNPTYENFITSVATNRGLKKEEIMPFTEGKIYVANTPEIQGVLVDEISSLYQIKKEIRERLDDNETVFSNVEIREQPSFFPKVQVDLGLKEMMRSAYLTY